MLMLFSKHLTVQVPHSCGDLVYMYSSSIPMKTVKWNSHVGMKCLFTVTSQ